MYSCSILILSFDKRVVTYFSNHGFSAFNPIDLKCFQNVFFCISLLCKNRVILITLCMLGEGMKIFLVYHMVVYGLLYAFHGFLIVVIFFFSSKSFYVAFKVNPEGPHWKPRDIVVAPNFDFYSVSINRQYSANLPHEMRSYWVFTCLVTH